MKLIVIPSLPYLDFQGGSTFATCERTDRWNGNQFMPHAIRQMKGFSFSATVPPASEYKVEDSPTYLLGQLHVVTRS